MTPYSQVVQNHRSYFSRKAFLLVVGLFLVVPAGAASLDLAFNPHDLTVTVFYSGPQEVKEFDLTFAFDPPGAILLGEATSGLEIDAEENTVHGASSKAATGGNVLAMVPLKILKPLDGPVSVNVIAQTVTLAGEETVSFPEVHPVRIHPSQVNYQFEKDTQPAAAPGTIMEASFSTMVTHPAGYAYLEWLPRDYQKSAEKTWPLILFLHGAGERAVPTRDLQRLGPLNYAANHPEFPFIVIAPHCPLYQDWAPESLDALLQHSLQTRRVDPDRVYLTGFSMGGAGTWEMAMDYPARFAAIAPLCGRVIPLKCGNLWYTPIWAFQGEKDEVVPPTQTYEMVDILQGMGHFETKLTRYPDLGHEIWSRVYANPALYDWFLSHKRGGDPYSQK